MIGLLYLILCFTTGLFFCSMLLPKLNRSADHISSCFVLIPAWFVTGTIILSWTTYIFACVFSGTASPLSIANVITILLAVLFIVVCAFLVFKDKFSLILPDITAITLPEALIFAAVSVFVIILMLMSFNYKDGNYYISLSVFSDFTPHLSMIRSFSIMQNFPTEYSVFAGEDIKYHFMYEFLTGNLEFLGMRLDIAFNTLSILSLIFVYALLYTLAVRLSGKRTVGYLTLLLLTFRSSYSFWDYVKSLPKDDVLSTLRSNAEFIGSTPNENWGLYNLNVYINQRHLAFGLCILLLAVLIFVPYVESAFERISNLETANERFKSFFFTTEGWLPADLKGSIAFGFILGGLAFYNGAVMISAVLIMFFMAILSDNRLDYVFTAAIAGLLAILQSRCFIKESGFDLSFQYGYLSEYKTVSGCIDFVLKMMGILPIILIIAFVLTKGAKRYLMFAFSIPMIFAFNVSLTPDIAVNHKYIMMSVMLLDIFAAEIVETLFANKDIAAKTVAMLLCIALTITGFYEFKIICRKNGRERSIELRETDEITEWIAKNCDKDDMILSDMYYLSYGDPDGNYVLMSGAKMYLAWPYFAWSAGYDTYYRTDVAQDIFDGSSVESIRQLARDEHIDYIVIDDALRDSSNYELNEELIKKAFTPVFATKKHGYSMTIYSTDVN